MKKSDRQQYRSAARATACAVLLYSGSAMLAPSPALSQVRITRRPLVARPNYSAPNPIANPFQTRPNRPFRFNRGIGAANIDPARALLRKMQEADRSLAFAGEQTTVLAGANGRTVQSTQTVYRDGNRNYRCEYHAPGRLAGEIIVARSDKSWHYMPYRQQLVVEPPNARHLMTQIGPAMRALHDGTAQATILGNDTVAGQQATVLQITGSPQTPTGSVRLWIDPYTGAQLRIEVYDAAGNLQSTSFFTQITYAPNFPSGTFDAPAVPPGTKTIYQQGPKKLEHIPSDAEAGFHVQQPTFLPPGYQFQSASVFTYAGGKAVALRYTANLSLLSVFERPVNNPQAAMPQPRAGTVIIRQNGMELIAMGTLADTTMVNVLQSMR